VEGVQQAPVPSGEISPPAALPPAGAVSATPEEAAAALQMATRLYRQLSPAQQRETGGLTPEQFLLWARQHGVIRPQDDHVAIGTGPL